MDECGFSEVDFELGSFRARGFSSSSDFRQVMSEMYKENPDISKKRASERWARLRRQPSNLNDIVDGEESAFAKDPGQRKGFTFPIKPRRLLSRQSSSKLSSNDDVFSDTDTSSPPRKISTATMPETDRDDHYKLHASSTKGWHAIRRYVEEKKFQHQTSHATMSWAILRQHLFQITDAERTRRDLYERYGVIPRLNNDGTYTTGNVMLTPRSNTRFRESGSGSV